MRWGTRAVFALFAALLVASAPASSATTIVAEHDSADELRSGMLNSASVAGEGDSAYVGLFERMEFGGEEDGDLSEWSGETASLSTVNPIAPMGTAAIRLDTDGTRKQVSRPVPVDSAPVYSFYIADKGGSSNNEVLFNASGSTLWGVFAKQNSGLYWSAVGERDSGTPINTSLDMSSAHEVTIRNINPSAGTVEVYVDGRSEGTFSYLSSGSYPDTLSLATNTGTDDRFVVDWIHYRTDTSSGTYTSAPYSADDVTAGAVNLTLDNAEAVVTWQSSDGGGWTNVTSATHSSSGTKTADLSSVAADEVRVRVELSRNSAGSTARVEGDTAFESTSPPSASDLEPTGEVPGDPEYSVNVTDGDFGTPEGDTVTATLFIGGEAEYTETVTSNGTVSAGDQTPSISGETTYHWRLTDSYGLTTVTDTVTVNAPATLYVYNATDPDQLVVADLTVRFYADGTVEEMTSTGGDLSLTGLPVGQEFVVSVNPGQGYYPRRTVINSIYDQQAVYLLPTDSDSAEVLFELDDPTGVYTNQAQLYIERPLDVNGETEYQTVAAAEFGAGGFSTQLLTGTRYQLRIENQDGETAVLGSYTPTAADAVTLRPSTSAVSREAVDQNAIFYNATVVRDANRALVYYDDPNNATSELTVSIVNKWNSSDYLRPPQTFYNTDSLVLEEPINGSLNTSYIVYFNGTRDGEPFHAQVQIGPGGVSFVPENIGEPWGVVAGVLIMLLSAGLFSRANVGTGTVVVALEGGILWYIGLLDGVVTAGVVVVAVGFALLFNMSDRP